MKIDPVLVEVFKNRFASIAEEMGVTLNRTAYSPNIKERRDYSCALFNREGQMIAQAAHIPVHLGSMPISVSTAIRSICFKKGDMAILNNPFEGGTHLPDITIVAPYFAKDDNEPSFYMASRAHHSDVGGMSSGSMPLSTSLYQEGVIIPPLKIIKGGELDPDLMNLILNNVRTPEEREGDFSAQFMANFTGQQRMEELIEKYSLDTVELYAGALIDYSEKMMRQAISQIPDGIYEFEDFMDGDGIDSTDVRICVKLTIIGDEAGLDFTGSSPQVKGSINAVYSITLSAVLYVFMCLLDRGVPANAGCTKPLKILAPEGSILNAKYPAAVAAGNVETSQRIVDVVMGCLANALPGKIPAASQGTMNNVSIGGFDPVRGRPFAYYETIGGGMGANSSSHGENAVHSHMTNTLNTPVEALEYAYPFLVNEYSVRRGTGGNGKYLGGDGIIREMTVLADSEVTVLSERRIHGAYGIAGGRPGLPGKNTIIEDGHNLEMPGKFNTNLKKNSVLRIETPGGGGYGNS